MSLPKWIKKELGEKIIPKLKDLSDKQILEIIKTIVYKGSPKDRTITWRYSLIKRYMKSHTKDKMLLYKMKPPDELTNSVIKKNKEKRDSEKRLIISKDLIKKILAFEKSNDVYEMYIYLLLVSGRRLREITNAKFMNVKSSNQIIIDGITKLRGKDNGSKVKFTPLVSKTKFFRVYRKFNRINKNSNIKKMSDNLQRIIKVKLNPKLKAHDLRRAYAMYAYTFRNKGNIKVNPFIKEALNHSTSEASMSYTGIVFEFKKDIIK